jgi:prepilin-type N-terminal cleavage/methylation domain-containing protein
MQPNKSPAPAHRKRAGFSLIELVIVLAIVAIAAGLLVRRISSIDEDAKLKVANTTLAALRVAYCGDGDTPGLIDDLKLDPNFSYASLRMHHLLAPKLSMIEEGYAAYDPLIGSGWRGPYARASDAIDNISIPPGGRPLPGTGEIQLANSFPAPNDLRQAADLTFLERNFYGPNGEELYGKPGDLIAADPWGNPIVLQIPAASAFPAGTGEAERFRFARLVSAGPNGIIETPYEDHGSEKLARLAGRTSGSNDTPARGDDSVLFLMRAEIHE